MKLIGLVIFFSALLCGCLAGESAARSLYWQKLLVNATLTADGRLLVREEQNMVFTGDWNGGERIFSVRPGQTFSFTGISRILPEGELLRLHKGSLEKVDNWNWASNDTLRWRSRLPGDPPFSATAITYVLEYSLGRILMPQDDGSFRLNHDFTFPHRSGEIRTFRLTLHFDLQWRDIRSPVIIEQEHVAPGQSVFHSADLFHSAPEIVESYQRPLFPVTVAETATKPAAGWLTWSGAGLLLAMLLFASAWFYRHEIKADRFGKAISPVNIDAKWLEEHLFSLRPETVGAAWDKATSGHEVAAILARLVAEGKLASRLEHFTIPLLGWKIPGMNILHLELRQPRQHFADHERPLIEGFFIDGETTDTRRIRHYYRKLGKSFIPAEKIRRPLEQQVKKLTGSASRGDQSTWLAVVLLALAGLILLIVNGFVHQPEVPLTIFGGLFAIIGSIAGSIISHSYKTRSDHLIRRSLQVHLFPLLALLLYIGLGLAGISSLLALGLLLFFTFLILATVYLARTDDSPEGVKLCRNLTAAREYLRKQLQQENPAIRDEWFPYLLAFGLGPDVDRWSRRFTISSTFAPGLPATASTTAGRTASAAGAAR